MSKKIKLLTFIGLFFAIKMASAQTCQWENAGVTGVHARNVYDIIKYQDKIYLGGHLLFGNVVDGKFAPIPEIDAKNGRVELMKVLDDGKLYIAGIFNVNGLNTNLATYDGEKWETFSFVPPGAEPNNFVFVSDLAIYNGEYIIAAASADFKGNPNERTSLYKFNSSTKEWELFAGGFKDNVSGAGGAKLLVQGENLYLVGTVKMFGLDDLPVNKFAKWDGSNWSNLGGKVTNSPTSFSDFIFEHNNKIYITGQGLDFCSPCNPYLAVYDGNSFSDIGYTGNRIFNLSILDENNIFTFGSDINIFKDGQWELFADRNEYGNFISGSYRPKNGEIWVAGISHIKSRPDLGGDMKKIVCSPVLDISNQDVSPISLFTDLANGFIHVKPNPGISNQDLSFQLFNIHGTKVNIGKIENNKINVQNLPSGIYLLKVLNNGEPISNLETNKILIY